MKTFRRALTLILSLMLIAFCSMTVMAAADDYGEDYSGTKYTVRVYSGKEATFAGGKTVVEYPDLEYGSKIKININSADLKPVLNGDAADKYYVRGFKMAGHDNDETSRMNINSYEYTVTGDASFSVAYGMKGAMVGYTVNYVDANGRSIHPSEVFYGMPGDYPVVSYQYVEGYTPDVENMGRTLTDKAEDNVFTFTYTRAAAAADTDEGTVNAGANNANRNAGTGNANGGRTAANNGAAGNAGTGANNGNANGDGNGAGTTIGDNPTPMAGDSNVVDLDNGDVPAAEPDESETSDTQKQFKMSTIIAGACAVLLIAGAAAAIMKRRNGEYEEDEEDE